MFDGWNQMMLVEQHLQEVEKQVICITKALCRGRFKGLKIGFNDKTELAEREFLAGLSTIMRNDACLFDYLGFRLT